MGKRENSVETYFDKQVRRLGGKSYKWVSPGCVGVTDRIAIISGKVYFVEIKTCDGTLSPMQERRIQEINNLGAFAIAIYGMYGVDEFIEKINKGLI